MGAGMGRGGIAVSKHVILALEGPWDGEVEVPGGAELEV